MKWKLLVSLLACAAFFAANAKAQDAEKIDLYAGYSYLRANPSSNTLGSFGLNGGNASLAYHVTPWLSAVADFGGYTNSDVFHSGSSGTASTYLFGPRVSFRHIWRVHPFVEALFGAAHGNSSLFDASQSHNAFAAAVGGGFDFRLSHHWSLRPLEVDYLPTRFPEATFGRQTQDNLRASTGIVFHF
jgi:opacity protein-like surface antigen